MRGQRQGAFGRGDRERGCLETVPVSDYARLPVAFKATQNPSQALARASERPRDGRCGWVGGLFSGRP